MADRAWVRDYVRRLLASAGGGPPSGAAGGDLGGTYPNPTVSQARGIRETSGPTTLVVGAVADGEYLRRSGATVVGGAGGSGAPVGSSYVVVALDGTLTSERRLQGTAGRVTLTDAGAGADLVIDVGADVYRAGGTDVAIADGGTGQSTASAGFAALCPTNALGDLVVDNGTIPARLAVGTNGQALVARSTASLGVAWEDAIGDAWSHQRIGGFYPAGIVSSNAPTYTTLNVDKLLAFPIVPSRTGTIDQLAVWVHSGQTAGDTCWLGVYADSADGTLYPAALLDTITGALDCSTTGWKVGTLTAPVTIEKGKLYWAVITVGGSLVNFRAGSTGDYLGILGVDGSLITSGSGIGWTVARAFAALPATFTAGATYIYGGVTADKASIYYRWAS